MSSSAGTQEGKREKLRSDAMKGNWSEVFEMFKQEKALRTAKITAAGDTVLHMAVYHGKEKVVANMVDFLVWEEKNLAQLDTEEVVVTMDGDNEESWNMNIILEAEDERKNTPLHLAATIGNVEMCKKISGPNPSFVARRNIAGESPLFLAALYGRKEAFLWLHYHYMSHPGISSTDFAHCIRDNDDTILHCAIAEEHFDVAIEIVYLYKDLVRGMRRNKEGLSPLHLLASKRFAFPTTGFTEVPFVVRPIYWLLRVGKKNQATTLEELQKKNQENNLVKYINWLVFVKLPTVLSIFSEFAIWIWIDLIQIKQKHKWSLQIMNELLQHVTDEDMSQIISRTAPKQLSISLQTEDNNELEAIMTPASGNITIETPLMIAAKNGVVEMVEKILELFPLRIKDVNAEGKNIVLLSVEYRQTQVFMFLVKQKWPSQSLFKEVDKEGNNAVHLAARLGVEPDWLNRGEGILSMTREIRWFDLVEESMPCGSLKRYNKKMETPNDIFKENHKELMKSEGKWLVKTSQACSVVSTLVISVAYATRTNVPGGYDDKHGFAILRNKSLAFKFFDVSSLLALLFSLFSTIIFLSVLASPSQSVLSWRFLPLKLYYGLCFMFGSIVCLWISFIASDFFILDDKSRKLYITLPTYIFLSSVIITLLLTQLPTFILPILASGPGIIPPSRRKVTLPIEYRRTKNKENGTDLNHQN